MNPVGFNTGPNASPQINYRSRAAEPTIPERVLPGNFLDRVGRLSVNTLTKVPVKYRGRLAAIMAALLAGINSGSRNGMELMR